MDTQQIPQHMYLMLPVFFGFFAVASVVLVIPYWQIFKKAGFSPFLALLMFVPLANIVILYVVAFSQWRVVPTPDIYPANYPVGYPPAPPPAQSPYPVQSQPPYPGQPGGPTPPR